MAEQTSGESGSVGAGPAAPHASEAQNEPVAASVPESISIDAPKLVPEQGGEAAEAGAPKADVPKAELPKAELPKAEAAKADAPKTDAPKAEANKADAPRTPGKIMIMSAGDHHGWDAHESAPEPESKPASGMFGSAARKRSSIG